jgi:hypothetical protein
MARTWALGSMLKNTRGKERQKRHVSVRTKERERMNRELFIWRIRGLLWIITALLSICSCMYSECFLSVVTSKSICLFTILYSGRHQRDSNHSVQSSTIPALSYSLFHLLDFLGPNIPIYASSATARTRHPSTWQNTIHCEDYGQIFIYDPHPNFAEITSGNMDLTIDHALYTFILSTLSIITYIF